MIKVTFIGGTCEVTGSMHMVETSKGKILLDCGMYQGHRAEAAEKNRNFGFYPEQIHSVILSHAHIDHSGRLPLLHKEGFNGNVYMTSATRDLAAIMLRDSAHIQQADVEYINRKRARHGEAPVPPLYSINDATRVLRHFVSIGYGRRFMPMPDVTATCFDAGHILGSALVRLDINNGGKPFRIGYVCDLGRAEMPILRNPQSLLNGDCEEKLDALIIETTYGGRFHDSPADVEAQLADLINRVYERGGKLVIPAFSVGRTQNLLYYLHKLFSAGRIPAVPVFVDSPLSVNATDIFRMHPECYDQATADFVEMEGPVFTHKSITYVKSLAESKALNRRRKPAIIISAAGMCEAGRILHHLANNITKAKNAIAIVGFMAKNTLGRRLVEKHPKVKIFGEHFPVRAEVATLNGLSAHADHKGIVNYVKDVCAPHSQIFLVHGENGAMDSVKETLWENSFHNVSIPTAGTIAKLQ